MYEVYGVVLITLIIGLVELLKVIGLPKKLLPVAAIIFGLAAGIFYAETGDLKGGIIVGLMLGLAASGLYSGGKAMIEKVDK